MKPDQPTERGRDDRPGIATRAGAPAAVRHAPKSVRATELTTELEGVFRTELRERVDAMKASLDVLRRGVDEPTRMQLIGSLIRHAHSLRGAAQIIGLARLAAIAGALEKRLDAAPNDDAAVRTAVDAIARIGERFGMAAVDEVETSSVGLESRSGQAAAAEAAGLAPELGPLRILHVEDGHVNRALVGAILARTSHPRVRESVLLNAESLAEARAILRSQAVDLVLLDVRLPDGDGLDLARELRSAPGKRIPVVVVSASVLPVERLAALAAGGDQFIGKPVDPKQLVETVAAVARARLAAAS